LKWLLQIPLLALLGGGDATLDLVRAGHAGRAYARLANEVGTNGSSARVDFLVALLRVLRCVEPRELEHAPAGDRSRAYEKARRLLSLEFLRAERLHREGRTSGAYLFAKEGRLDWAMAEVREDAIAWPLEAERWSDETDIPAPPTGRCIDDAAAPAEPGVEITAAELKKELAAAKATLAFLDEPNLRSAVLFHVALLGERLSDDATAWWAAEQLARQVDDRGLADSEQAEAALLIASIAERHLAPEAAVASWDVAAKRAPADWLPLIDLHRQRLQVKAGQTAEAMATLSRHADDHDELSTFFLYRLALLKARANDEAGLFQIARTLLAPASKRSVANQPPLRAVQALAFTALVAHELNDALMALLAAFGPVAELHARIEAFAEFALQHDRASLALALYDRLLSERQSSRSRPYYLSGLAVSAVRAGDQEAFRKAYSALVGEIRQPEGKHGLEWDRQLLLTTRQVVAFLGPRRADDSLKVLVSQLQPLLRDTQGPYGAEMTQLYRLASSRLKLGTRGYAESTGEGHSPIWLGDIQVAKLDLDVAEPELPMPELLGPTTLIALPDSSGKLRRWWGPEKPTEDIHAQ
jgi:hypothetical protein